MANLTISQLARVASVNLETIRFYEAQRLLPKPPRSPAGYRQYGPDAADRIRFIKRAQELGFSLNEIRELLELRTGPSASQAEIRGRALAKIREIEQKIRDLEAIKANLEKLTRACSGYGPLQQCPIIENLDVNSNCTKKEERNGTKRRRNLPLS